MRLWTIFLLAAVAACAPSAPDSPAAADIRGLADEACPTVTRPFFYTVEKDGTTSYLLGTRHAGVPLAKFPASVRDALASAKIIVTESEIDLARKVPPPARSVEDELGSDDWKKYRELVGPQVADRVNHRSIGAAVAGIVLLYEDADRSVDLEVQKAAAGRELVHFEDRAASDAIGDELLSVDKLRALLKMARKRSMVAASTREDLKQYCTGQAPNASHEMLQSLDRRNAAWIVKLEPLLARGDVFVAVGRAHLTEHGGLVDMLRARGYTLNLRR